MPNKRIFTTICLFEYSNNIWSSKSDRILNWIPLFRTQLFEDLNNSNYSFKLWHQTFVIICWNTSHYLPSSLLNKYIVYQYFCLFMVDCLKQFHFPCKYTVENNYNNLCWLQGGKTWQFTASGRVWLVDVQLQPRIILISKLWCLHQKGKSSK